MEVIMYKSITFSLLAISSCIARQPQNYNNLPQLKKNQLLIRATESENLKEIRTLVNAGADANYRTLHPMSLYYSPDQTALIVATKHNDLALMDLLIKKGANVNTETSWDQPHAGEPALTFAVANKSIEAVKKLLNAGANPNRYACRGNSQLGRNIPILAFALKIRAPEEIITELIAHNVDPNLQAIMALTTPLTVAALIGNMQAVESLLKTNYSVTKQNISLAYILADEYGHAEIAALLKKYL